MSGVLKFLYHWQTMIKVAKDNLTVAKQRQAQYTNQHRRELEFKVGDKVLLSTKNINNPIDKNHPIQKLTPKFIGPYIVAKAISKVAYKLELPTNMRIHPRAPNGSGRVG